MYVCAYTSKTKWWTAGALQAFRPRQCSMFQITPIYIYPNYTSSKYFSVFILYNFFLIAGFPNRLQLPTSFYVSLISNLH